MKTLLKSGLSLLLPYLESLFAKLRSHIIDEKRPGSIVIDGGGRISYISEKSKENEQNGSRRNLYNSFLQSTKEGMVTSTSLCTNDYPTDSTLFQKRTMNYS